MNLIAKLKSFFKKKEKTEEQKNYKPTYDSVKKDDNCLDNAENPSEETEEKTPLEKVSDTVCKKETLRSKKKIPVKKSPSPKPDKKKEKIRKISTQDDLYELFTGEKNPGIREYTPSGTVIFSRPSKNCRKSAKLKSQKIVDLHGLSFTEADKKIENSIISAKHKGHGSICFITGKGNHSKNMKPVLRNLAEKKAVEMKKNGKICSFEWEKKQKKKSGSIIIYL